MIDLSVVVISYNCRAFLEQCLASVVSRMGTVATETILVENGSTDGTVEMVRRRFPHVHLVQNATNRGVAPARNQGLRLARGRYCLILDADAEIVSDTAREMIAFMDARPEIGVLGCHMLTFDDQVYSSSRTFPRPIHLVLRRLQAAGWVGQSRQLDAHQPKTWEWTEPRPVDYVIGAFQLVRKSAMDRVGLLDEAMFYGFEDADYCARMRRAGYQVVHYPAFTVRHYVQAMARKKPLSRQGWSQITSYVRFYCKHLPLLYGAKE